MTTPLTRAHHLIINASSDATEAWKRGRRRQRKCLLATAQVYATLAVAKAILETKGETQ